MEKGGKTNGSGGEKSRVKKVREENEAVGDFTFWISLSLSLKTERKT